MGPHENAQRSVHEAIVRADMVQAYRTDPAYHASARLLVDVLCAVQESAHLSGMTPEHAASLCDEVADRLIVGGARKLAELALLFATTTPGETGGSTD